MPRLPQVLLALALLTASSCRGADSDASTPAPPPASVMGDIASSWSDMVDRYRAQHAARQDDLFPADLVLVMREHSEDDVLNALKQDEGHRASEEDEAPEEADGMDVITFLEKELEMFGEPKVRGDKSAVASQPQDADEIVVLVREDPAATTTPPPALLVPDGTNEVIALLRTLESARDDTTRTSPPPPSQRLFTAGGVLDVLRGLGLVVDPRASRTKRHPRDVRLPRADGDLDPMNSYDDDALVGAPADTNLSGVSNGDAASAVIDSIAAGHLQVAPSAAEANPEAPVQAAVEAAAETPAAANAPQWQSQPGPAVIYNMAAVQPGDAVPAENMPFFPIIGQPVDDAAELPSSVQDVLLGTYLPYLSAGSLPGQGADVPAPLASPETQGQWQIPAAQNAALTPEQQRVAVVNENPASPNQGLAAVPDAASVRGDFAAGNAFMDSVPPAPVQAAYDGALQQPAAADPGSLLDLPDATPWFGPIDAAADAEWSAGDAPAPATEADSTTTPGWSLESLAQPAEEAVGHGDVTSTTPGWVIETPANPTVEVVRMVPVTRGRTAADDVEDAPEKVEKEGAASFPGTTRVILPEGIKFVDPKTAPAPAPPTPSGSLQKTPVSEKHGAEWQVQQDTEGTRKQAADGLIRAVKTLKSEPSVVHAAAPPLLKKKEENSSGTGRGEPLEKVREDLERGSKLSARSEVKTEGAVLPTAETETHAAVVPTAEKAGTPDDAALQAAVDKAIVGLVESNNKPVPVLPPLQEEPLKAVEEAPISLKLLAPVGDMPELRDLFDIRLAFDDETSSSAVTTSTPTPAHPGPPSAAPAVGAASLAASAAGSKPETAKSASAPVKKKKYVKKTDATARPGVLQEPGTLLLPSEDAHHIPISRQSVVRSAPGEDDDAAVAEVVEGSQAEAPATQQSPEASTAKESCGEPAVQDSPAEAPVQDKPAETEVHDRPAVLYSPGKPPVLYNPVEPEVQDSLPSTAPENSSPSEVDASPVDQVPVYNDEKSSPEIPNNSEDGPGGCEQTQNAPDALLPSTPEPQPSPSSDMYQLHVHNHQCQSQDQEATTEQAKRKKKKKKKLRLPFMVTTTTKAPWPKSLANLAPFLPIPPEDTQVRPPTRPRPFKALHHHRFHHDDEHSHVHVHSPHHGYGLANAPGVSYSQHSYGVDEVAHNSQPPMNPLQQPYQLGPPVFNQEYDMFAGAYEGRPAFQQGVYQEQPASQQGLYQEQPSFRQGMYQEQSVPQLGMYQEQPTFEQMYQEQPHYHQGSHQEQTNFQQGMYQQQPDSQQGLYEGLYQEQPIPQQEVYQEQPALQGTYQQSQPNLQPVSFAYQAGYGNQPPYQQTDEGYRQTLFQPQEDYSQTQYQQKADQPEFKMAPYPSQDSYQQSPYQTQGDYLQPDFQQTPDQAMFQPSTYEQSQQQYVQPQAEYLAPYQGQPDYQQTPYQGQPGYQQDLADYQPMPVDYQQELANYERGQVDYQQNAPDAPSYQVDNWSRRRRSISAEKSTDSVNSDDPNKDALPMRDPSKYSVPISETETLSEGENPGSHQADSPADKPVDFPATKKPVLAVADPPTSGDKQTVAEFPGGPASEHAKLSSAKADEALSRKSVLEDSSAAPSSSVDVVVPEIAPAPAPASDVAAVPVVPAAVQDNTDTVVPVAVQPAVAPPVVPASPDTVAVKESQDPELRVEAVAPVAAPALQDTVVDVPSPGSEPVVEAGPDPPAQDSDVAEASPLDPALSSLARKDTETPVDESRLQDVAELEPSPPAVIPNDDVVSRDADVLLPVDVVLGDDTLSALASLAPPPPPRPHPPRRLHRHHQIHPGMDEDAPELARTARQHDAIPAAALEGDFSAPAGQGAPAASAATAAQTAQVVPAHYPHPHHGPPPLPPALEDMLPKAGESEAEKAEREQKAVQRMIQVVNVLGSLQNFLSDRARTLVRRLSKIVEEEEEHKLE